MPEIIAIARGHLALELELTGMRVECANNSNEAQSLVEIFLQEKPDIVIVEKRLEDDFTPDFRELLSKHEGTPLIINCPSFDSEGFEAIDHLRTLVKSAVGYEIRFD